MSIHTKTNLYMSRDISYYKQTSNRYSLVSIIIIIIIRKQIKSAMLIQYKIWQYDHSQSYTTYFSQ